MPTIINPFAAGDYLAELTAAINKIKPARLRLRELGLFRERPVSHTTVVVEELDGTLSVLPSRPRGGPATVASKTTRTLRSFAIPHFPHDDVVLPADIQDVRRFGSDAPLLDPDLAGQKLEFLRAKHDLTREYLELNALFGTVKDGEGTTLYNYFTEFGLTQITVDFDLGTATTDVKAKCREVLRQMEEEARGVAFTGVRALVSSEFFDKLVNHDSVKEAYLNWQAASALSADVRPGFPFGGIVFEEYRTVFPKPGGSSERLIAANDGIAFPTGTVGVFETYFAPPNVIDRVNTPGVPIFVRAIPRLDGSGIDIKSESNLLPLVTRPRLCIKLTTTT